MNPRVIVSVLAAFALVACDKKAREIKPPEGAAIRASESTDRLPLEHASSAPDKNPTHWTDTAKTLSKDSLDALRDEFSRFVERQDTVYRAGPVWESLSKIANELFDFRCNSGSQNFISLKDENLDGHMFLGSRPKDGFSYYLVGNQGQLLQPPLKFDSMQVKLLASSVEEPIPLPAWRAPNRLDDTLQGDALAVGSKRPLMGLALAHVPINDSLKKLILHSIFPNKSMLQIFYHIDFFPAGADRGRQRFFLAFTFAKSEYPQAICAVEVVDEACKLLFFLSQESSEVFINAFSLTAAPIADVFVARLYETHTAIFEVKGRWIGIPFEYPEYYNRD